MNRQRSNYSSRYTYNGNRDNFRSDYTNNSTNLSDNKREIKNEELSKEEKLKKRQEQLAAWRQKKEEEQKKQEKPLPSESTSTSDVNDNEEKKRLRQKRIEEWKRKRLQESDKLTSSIKAKTESIPITETKTSISIRPLGSKTSQSNDKPINKRFIFEEDEDDTPYLKPRFKKPVLFDEESEKQQTMRPNIGIDEIDELDKFIQVLEQKGKPESLEFNDKQNLVNDDDAPSGGGDDLSDEEELNEEEEQQKLLSSKLLKLQNKEKELDVIDHSTINYNSFRKDFYTEPIEIQRLSEEQINALRFELDGIKVRGLNCPRPILRWSQLGLPSSIMTVIEERLQYTKPSSIQSQALPAIMSGRDIIGVAKTGSGKTLSFVLPMLRHIQDQPQLRKGDGPIGLIMTPTRELALQIYKELTNFTKKLNLSVSCCYGGSPIESQIADLKKGAEILVGTPGRIIDLLAANSGRVANLRRVTYLVLDEADRMFDMGFEPQVTKVFSQVRPDRQTVLFSATFPRKMELLAKKVLDNPIEIIVGGISIVASEIAQQVELFEVEDTDYDLDGEKIKKLIKIMDYFSVTDPNAKILIFVEKQTAADDLLVKLLSKEYLCLAIHGGKDQLDRKHAIKDFSSPNSGINILIATSVAARGLDVKGLNLVINYDAPNHMEDYVHRVGRTGRAGMKGTAITFVSSQQERPITDLVKAMRLSKIPESDIPPRLIEISEKFLEKVKSGKVKFSFGFGGKGLENLQEIRDSTRDLQRKVFGEDTESAGNTTNKEKTLSKSGTPETKLNIKLPDFHIIEGRAPETSGPDKCKFHSRITINDLPQKARWIVVNRDSLSKIIESTSTSITNKGQYYPPNAKIPKTIVKNGNEVAAPPKLYLLVEGLTESSVRDANNLIRQRMIEGLEISAKEESKIPTGKYTV